MKKIIVFTLLLISIMASAQNDVVEDTTAQPAITEAGKPDGKIAEMKMNKDGGTLVSGDGKLELIIPSGALLKKTTISIQPVTNMMPNGNGQAYRLEPSGIQFKKPVQLIFHYTDEESADSAQLLMGLAMQDDKGQWYGLDEFTLDTVAKTISGNVHHFCTVCKFDVLKINPASARVKVKKTIILQVHGMEPFPKETDGPDLTFLNRTAKKAIWSVNNIERGNFEFGTLKYGTADYFKPYNTYYAPASVPDKNPVAVSVKLQTVKYNGINFKDFTLVSNILIYDDAYEVTMICEIQDPGTGTNLGAVTYRDTGSFVVSLNGREPRIIERINKNTSASLVYSGGCCYNYKILKPGWGNIHIAGTPVIKKIPPAADGKPSSIEIRFSRVASIFPLFQVTCQCPGDKKPFTSTNDKGVAMMAGMLPAFPIVIKFEAKEGEHTILEFGKPGADHYAKFTVKQLKDED